MLGQVEEHFHMRGKVLIVLVVVEVLRIEAEQALVGSPHKLFALQQMDEWLKVHECEEGMDNT